MTSGNKRGRPSQGTIDHRGAHQWRLSITVNGRRIRRTCATRAEAEQYLADLQGEAAAGRLPRHLAAQEMTLGGALRRYLRRECPAKSYKGAANKIAWLEREQPALLGRSLYRTDESDIDAYIDWRLGTGVSPATANRDLSLMSRAFVLARTKWGCRGLQNPVSGMKLPEDGTRVRRLSEAEESALMNAAAKYERDPRNRVPISLIIRYALASAMRMGELARMCWEDVNWQQHTVLLRTTKNGHPRTVAMAPSAVELLRCRGPCPTGAVWGSYQGMLTAWRRVREAAAAEAPSLLAADPRERFRFHDLRHEATSRLFEHTPLSDAEIASITGHRSAQSLWRYRHLRSWVTAQKLADAEAAIAERSAKVQRIR